MNTYKYREMRLLMNQEILIAIDQVFAKLATVASLAKVLKGKDKLSEERRFSDANCEAQADLYQLLLPMTKNFSYQGKELSEFCTNSEVIPLNLYEDLDLLLNYREESLHIVDSPFAPYGNDSEIMKDSIFEFFFRMVSIYRVKAWLNDIENGIEEYGVEPYIVPEDDTEETINLLDGIYDKNLSQLKEELNLYLLVNDDVDTADEAEDKTYRRGLVEALLKLLED